MALAAGTGSAQAAGYRYWSFWDLTGDNWTYATQGPASAHPGDGAVEGFRFAVSADSKDAPKPRTTPSFEAVCAATPTKDGTKRVALVIDFGTPQDAAQGETPPAPRTACAQVAPDATSADALAAVAKPLRYNSAALLCAIADYPRTGCGEQVADPARRPARRAREGPRHNGGPSAGLLAGAAAVVALGAAAIWQSPAAAGTEADAPSTPGPSPALPPPASAAGRRRRRRARPTRRPARPPRGWAGGKTARPQAGRPPTGPQPQSAPPGPGPPPEPRAGG